ncbi:hypothetical protein ACXZ1K_19080 [Pedobacter sp. PWIIR3]
MEDLLKNTTTLLLEYNNIIVESFSIQDYRNYNEVVLSATSCAVKGNTSVLDKTSSQSSEASAI